MDSYTVIGGGLAGLTAANALASQGHRVTLLEQSAHLGGRARTQIENGFSFNLGPHALYGGGPAYRTFRDWDIPFSGNLPPTSSRSYFVRGGELFPIVTGAGPLLATRLFSFREKMEVANLLRLLSSARSQPMETAAAWLDRHAFSPRVREFAATAIRVATFVPDLEHLDAGTALRQVAGALKHNVLYLDHGWQTLVDGLERRARSLGVDIRCGQQSDKLGSTDVRGVILAVGPQQVEQLTGIALPARRAVYLASLELGLDAMPDEGANVAFALDRPLYFSVHSAAARLAPQGSKLVHVAKYLGSKQQDPKAVRAELEEFASLVMPRWKQHTGFVRFLPDLLVSPVMPEVQGRPGVDYLKSKGLANVTIAGDWVGEEGMLTDAVVSSALQAASVLQGTKAAAA